MEFGAIIDGFCAIELPIKVAKARSIVFDKGSGQIFVLERGTQSIVHLFDSDGDGYPDTKQVVASAGSLNHGLAIYDGYIYASSDSTVFRWPYNNSKDSFPLEAEVEIIVTNINEDGMGGAPLGHTTRTIVFDESDGSMYISVGSNKNIDPDSYRSRIRRFGDIRTATDFPLDFQTMDVFADGLRNEVGMAFDQHGILWGVENSADNLNRADLGGDIHEDNPSEELNRFDPKEFDVSSSPKHYGYPYCWTEYELPTFGKGRGTQWVWPSFHENFGGSLTDEDCMQYEAPVMALQGHSAPLGITFYAYQPPEELPESCSGSFPSSMNGYAFIAYHGSWNRDVPTGYKVVYVEMDAEGTPSSEEPVDLLAHAPPNAKWEDGFRPVDVAFDECGRLLVTSDGTRGVGSKVVRIDYGDVAQPAFASSSSHSLNLISYTTIFLCLFWVLLAMR